MSNWCRFACHFYPISIAFIAFVIWLGPSKAYTQSKTLAIALPSQQTTLKKPASDLLREGRVLEVGEASALAETGFDLSDLNPQENRFWQNKSYSSSDEELQSYPEASVGVAFESFEAATKFTSLIRVRSLADSRKVFRLGLSRYSQAMMMRAALLRKLGYYIPSPRYYKNLRINFANLEDKEKFIQEAQLDTGADFESRKWIRGSAKNSLTLELSSATLEVMNNDYYDLQWGLAPNPEDPRQLPMVQRFSRYRAYRALIIPYSLVDVPESVNRFSPRYLVVSSGYSIISYFMADAFQATSYEDIRWILKRLSQISLADLREVVRAANYPRELEEVVLAKLVARIKNAFSIFLINSSLPDLSLDISSPNGIVKGGKVMQEFISGYPQRFSHGERNSPYQEGDLARYLGIDLRTSAIKNITDRLNNKLQLLTIEDAANRYQQEVYKKISEHIATNPGQPLYKEITSWGGPVAGLNLQASRHIATGTYSGSTAPVQLVDNLSVGAGIGYFRALDGLEKYVPALGANISVVRDYTHVRPILSIKEASKESWKNLLLPQYMHKLSAVLISSGELNKEEVKQHSLDQFLNELRDGEVFTISDSVALSSYISANSSLDILLGITPFNFVNSVTLGADANRVILRQVSFHRVSNDSFNGVHVYVREMKNKARGVEFNLNYYLNLLKIRAQSTDADISSEGFLIDYNPGLSAEVDPTTEAGKKLSQTRDNLRLSLLPLFRDNDTELLYAKFEERKFNVKHNLKTKESKLRFLWWRFQSFTEDHLLKILYPKNKEYPDLKPEDEEVSLFSSRKGELRGRDYLGFGFESIDAILANNNKEISLGRGAVDNPANTPQGKAYWKLITSEADLSVNLPQYPSVSQMQYVWGGWSLTKKRFFKVLDEIKKHFAGSDIDFERLIDRRDFNNMNSLDFYRITANLSILNAGLEKIKVLLTQSLPGQYDRKKADRKLYEEVIRILGNGDLNQGWQEYSATCYAETYRRLGPDTGDPQEFYKGNTYECLSRWMRSLIDMAHRFPKDNKKEQTKWFTAVLSLLEENISTAQLLKYLGEENYIFLVRINGFRSGDEDGDLEYFSNTLGDPPDDYSYAGGLINLYVRKTGLMPTELDRTVGGFK